ncbi:DNA glycosylase AlkZ-like family protein [Corticicoccus populi]|uniref:DNA glycosylase AlkZ-like family protein n=1 Tax=Corticicoccus populi TaxID=1812821 RepID=A0ABW5WV76_9STAP
MNELMDYRLNHSLITDKKESVHSVLSHVIGIQAQYPNYAKINIINRLHENAYSHFHHSLDHPETVMAWGQRRTVHYYSKEDWLCLAVFFEREVKWPDKHLHNMGYSIDDEIKRMESLFSNRNPVEKKDLQEYYQEEWKDLFHWSALFLKASSEGNLYFKLKENKKYYYWNHFDEIQVDRKELELKMLRQYFSAYGPATKADAAHFFGVRQSFFTIPFEEYFNVYQIEGINYYYSDLQCSNQNPEVILLGKFDPLLLAYKDKRWIVSKDEEPQIWRKAAQVEAVVIINNKFAGTWRYKVRGGRVVFNVFLSKPVNKYLKGKIKEALQPFAFALNKEFHAVEFL